MPTALRVLIAEDRPTDAELMVHELSRSGFEPKWKRVETQAEYLAELAAVPDVILADHTLPEFNAPRALDLLKETGLDIPLIVVTGSISEEVAVERIKQGASDYILKDRMTRLGPAVKRALEEKKLRDEKHQAAAALQARYQELQTLHEINRTILGSLDLKGILEKILDKALSVGSFDLGVIRLLDPTSKILETAASRGYRNPENLRLHQQRTTNAVTGRLNLRVLTFKEPLIEENVQGCGGLRTFKKEGIQSAIVIPVHTEEETIGVLQLGSRTSRKFQAEEVRLFEAIGNQMGIAIQKARLYEETRRNLERIRALHEIDLAISSTLELRMVLEFLLERIDLFLPHASATTIRLFNKESGLLEPVACRNLNEVVWKAEEGKAGRGLANVVFETKATLTVRKAQADPRTRGREFFTRYGLVSYLGVPLMAKREVLGVLGFYTKYEHQFSDEEVEFLSTLAGQAAIAINNAQLYEKMVTANRVKDEFLSVMSHELRTPLNVVMGFTGLIQDRMLGEINQKQEEACQKVIRHTQDLLSMVNSILYATCLEAKEVKIDRRPMNIGDFLGELKSSFELQLEKDLTLAWDCPSDLPLVTTDSRKLQHILQNLIDNAIKFTEKGSVTISAKVRQEAKGKGQQYAEFMVADTGIGIAKEKLPIIFDKFKQVDSSETRLFGGVGLGLYIAKEFAELIGGKVDVESEPGKGSTFTVTIPLGN